MTSEHLSADILALLALLHEYEVRYLIIGGEAVGVGAPSLFTTSA